MCHPLALTPGLTAGSFLAVFFHVYCSYRTTFTKRELHSDFKEAQPIAKAALSSTRPHSDFFSNTSATHSEIAYAVGKLPTPFCRPSGNRDLQSPSHGTHMQMEKMVFSAQRQPEFCQVLMVSYFLGK